MIKQPVKKYFCTVGSNIDSTEIDFCKRDYVTGKVRVQKYLSVFDLFCLIVPAKRSREGERWGGSRKMCSGFLYRLRLQGLIGCCPHYR